MSTMTLLLPNAKPRAEAAFSISLEARDFCPPGGRRPWMAAVFGSRQDAESENADVAQRSRWRFVDQVLSLVTFFAPAKKVTRLQAKAFDLSSMESEGQGQARFALAREFISFAGPKETNQRKGPSPTRRNGNRLAGRDFRTRHPWLDPKTAGILPAALRVWLAHGLFARKTKPVVAVEKTR